MADLPVSGGSVIKNYNFEAYPYFVSTKAQPKIQNDRPTASFIRPPQSGKPLADCLQVRLGVSEFMAMKLPLKQTVLIRV